MRSLSGPEVLPTMLTLRRSEDRGHADHGWLDTRHTFSFADYYHPSHMGFRALRVINEDRVQPGKGFGTHGHRDMEILSYVLAGALEHKDSLGDGSVIRPNDVQRMSAGTGVLHSEYNHSPTELVHFLQIWLLPEKPGIPPSYEQKTFSPDDKRGRLRLIASPDGADGSLTMHADARVYAAILGAGTAVEHVVARERHAWIQVARGRIQASGLDLKAGDGASTSDPGAVALAGREESEILLFDLG
jgi:redox-sensitive bicupin YhaK (pirin superfamily)